MRCCSPKRITLTGLLAGGGIVLLLLTLYTAMGVIDRPIRNDRQAGLQPRKTDRPDSRAPAGPTSEEAGGGGVPGDAEEGLAASSGSRHLTKSEREEADQKVADASKTAGTSEAVAKRKRLSRLRHELLEQAGFLALNGEDAAKNLVLVAQTYYRGGDLEASRHWFNKAQRMAADPDSATNSSVALRDVVKGLLAVGEIKWAESLVAQIPLPKYRDLARAEIVTILARKKRFVEAMSMAQALTDPGAKAVALRGIADVQARSGALNDAITTVSKIAAGRLRDDAWMRVALARATIGDAAGAISMISRISSARSQDLARVKVAEAQARSGGTGSPEILLSVLNDPFLRDESLRRIVEAQVARFKFDEAKASMYRINNQMERSLAMESLVGLQVRNGDMAGALERARDIVMEDSRTRALRTVAVGVTGKEGAASGRYVAALIKDDKQRDITYRRIAERSAALGRPRDAQDTVYNIDSPEERASALAEVANWRARRGAVHPARMLLQDAVREVEQIPLRKNQAKALGMLATAYAEAEDHGTALSTAASITDTGLRDRAYQQLSRKFAALPDIDLAEQTALFIVKEKTREQALDSMVQSIAGKVPPNKAMSVVQQFDSRRQQVKFLVAVAQRI